MEIGSRDEWAEVGVLTADDREASMSNVASGHRELILFRCEGTHSVISRSKAGVDYETGPMRAMVTTGVEEIARLEPGEVHETTIQTDRMVEPMKLRFTHQR